MIPDILVSKYLDGDLTIDEDVELRKQLSEDPSAKEAFDAAILIHIAMSCADPIEVPENARRDTLAAVFARIESAAAAPTSSGVNSVRSARILKPLAAVIALLLIMCAPVGDLFIGNGVLDESLVETIEAAQPGSQHFSIKRTRIIVEEAPVAPEYVNEVADAGNNLPIVQSNGLTNEESTPATLAVADPSFDPSWTEPPAVIGPAVVLGTFFGSGIGGSDGSMTNTTIISQSLGYKVGESTIIGFEFGSLSYASTSTTTANVSPRDPSAAIVRRTNGGESGPTKLEPTVPTNGSLRDTMTSTSTNTRFWGVAFVQQSLLRSGFAEVHVRGGLGVDEVGVMGFGRLTGQVRLQKWVSLSIGAEARSVDIQSFGILLSAVAGIQITP
ncbi:MAG: hypothetical protein H7X70_04500 [Candidatus Kapabacteria bacterium]|nr:hypothetical protein [Candidatus Kapabacteria bacterium]